MKGIIKSGSKSTIFEKKPQYQVKQDPNDLKHKSSLLDLSMAQSEEEGNKFMRRNNKLGSMNRLKVNNQYPEEEDISELNSPKTNRNDPLLPQASKQPQFSLAFLDDFKKYIEYRQQKKDQQKSQNELSSVRFNEQDRSRIYGGNMNNGEQHEMEDMIKQEYNQKVQKHKAQTKKIMLEINKKLKIQGKSKQERFEDQMQVFKNTDTYIEIKPFLEQLNKVNHSKFIQQIARYENNIKVAKQYQQQDDFLRDSDPQLHSSFYNSLTPKRSEEVSMRKFEDLIAKAYSSIIRSNNFQSYKLIQSNIIQKLMEELGYYDPNIPPSTDGKENIQNDLDENKQVEAKINQEDPPRKKSSRYASKEKQTISTSTELPKIKRKPSLEIGDLTSDDNQFFINLKEYLNKAQKDINLKMELETELNTYAQVIEENQRKIEEAKLEQVKKFMNGKLDPQHLFEGDKDIQLKEYYQRFREKAEQVRGTLHKVNQQLFQKKWANAQIKRQMERQRERNQLLSQFKNNKVSKNEDIMNPSKRMNQRLLRNRLLKQNQHEEHSINQSKGQLSRSSLNEESAEQQQQAISNRSIKSKSHEKYQNEDKNIYLTAPVEVSQQQQQQIKTLNNYQINNKYIDPTTEKKFKLINEKINGNSINLPLIHSTKSLQTSQMLSPIRPKQQTDYVLQSQTTKNSSSDMIMQPQLFKSTSKGGSQSQTPALYLSKKNSASNSQRNSQFDVSMQKKVAIIDPYNQRMSIYAQQQASHNYAEEEQQKIEQLIQEIDEEHNEYIQEKSNIKNQLELISQNFDKEMSKYQKSDNIDSIRGIQSDIPQHQYHSGLKQSKFNKAARH